MPPPIPDTDLLTILREADAAAGRLRRRLGLPRADLDDLRQELLLDLIRRLPAYDSRRGSVGAFAGIILRNQSSRIAMRLRRERLATGGELLSLDAMDVDGRRLIDRLAEDDGLAAWFGRRACPFETIDRRLGLARVLGALDVRDLMLCAAIARCPIRGLAGRALGARAA